MPYTRNVPDYTERGRGVHLRRIDGAFEGGAAKGFCYIGALDAIHRSGMWFNRVSGCSAGSITAALIAAGYRIDENYIVNLNAPPLLNGLPPNPQNSLNKIIFEDNYNRMYDFPDSLPRREIDDSWLKYLLDRLLPVNTVLEPLSNLKNKMEGLSIGFKDEEQKIGVRNNIRTWLKDRNNIRPLGVHNDLAEKIANALVNTVSLIINPIGKTLKSQAIQLLSFIPRDITLTLLSDIYAPKNSDPDQLQNVKKIIRTGFNVLENGGILVGDFFKEWLEKHLSARIINTGGYVAFKDLPMDLCVAAFCMDCNKMIYFSKQTTPNYSVSEAVRRSMSLPIIFIPRILAEGNYGLISNARDLEVAGRAHRDHLIIDGGVRVDLPAWVFRDNNSKFMQYYSRKLLVCFKLNELKDMPRKSSAGIPIAEDIDIPRFDTNTINSFMPPLNIDPKRFLPPGIQIMLKQAPYITEALTSKEAEIIKNIDVMGNTAIVDIGVKDIAGSDPRPWMFNISKKGKKWMAKSGWEAGLAFLNNLPPHIRAVLSIPDRRIDPYGG